MELYKNLIELHGEELAAEQIKLESESHTMGEERFLRAMERKAEYGEGADTRVARPLIADLVPKMVTRINQFLEEASQGAGRRHRALVYLRQITPERAAFMSIRAAFNLALRNSETTLIEVSVDIGAEIENEIRYGRLRERDVKWYNSVIQPAINKRSADHFKKAYVRAVEMNMEEKGEVQAWVKWPQDERALVGLKMVEFMLDLGIARLYDTHKGTKAHKKHFTVSEEVHKWLDARMVSLSGMNPLWAPCVVPPKPWTDIDSGGYWSESRHNPSFVKGMNRKAKRRYREVDLSSIYEAVNHIQNTPWAINLKVLEVAKEVSSWKHSKVKGMSTDEESEKTPRIDGMDTDAELLKEWKKAEASRHRVEGARRSRRRAQDFIIMQAEKFAGYERIWFPYNVDFRGRVYAIPSFCPQGTDLAKGLLLLADAVPMGPEGGKWLKMHTANTYGLDKAPMDERISWSEQNEDLICRVASDPIGTVDIWGQADSPFCFLAACFEYQAWLSTGDSYVCGLPIAFDGSCSGIQHFSAMLQDEVGGAAVNLVPADRPNDIYRVVADRVNEFLADLLLNGTVDHVDTITDEDTGEIKERHIQGSRTLAKQWLDFGVTRSVTKRSVMTLPYGSKKYGFTDQIMEDTITPAIDAGKGHMFKNPHESARFLAGLIWDALKTIVVAAVGAMDWLQKAAGALANQNMVAHWTTPVGFPVWQEYTQIDLKRIDTVICGQLRITMTVGMQHEDRPLNKKEQVSGIAPNFVHSMDASHLMMTTLACKAEGVDHLAMIHDSFGTCPGKAGTIFRVVREQFVKMYTENDVILGFYETFCNYLTDDALDKIPAIPQKGTLNLSSIGDSLYCFG